MAWLASTLIAFATAPAAHAQTGAKMRFLPMVGQAELSGDWTISTGAGVKGVPGSDVDLHEHNLQGRVRLDREDPRSVMVGFEVSNVEILATGVALPDRLFSVEGAVAFPLGESVGGWTFDAVVGVGYAGTNPLNDPDAWFADVAVMGTWIIEQAEGQPPTKVLQLALSYDGNRTVFPDIPLPFVAFTHVVTPEFTYIVGIPANSIIWRPTDLVQVRASTVLFTSFGLNAEVELVKNVKVFASYESRTDAYMLKIATDHRRLLFEQQRIEAGVRFNAGQTTAQAGAWSVAASFEIAVGYAFQREFTRGFDVRNTSTIADFSDEPYLRMGLQFRD